MDINKVALLPQKKALDIALNVDRKEKKKLSKKDKEIIQKAELKKQKR
jgi:hypothetical protein